MEYTTLIYFDAIYLNVRNAEMCRPACTPEYYPDYEHEHAYPISISLLIYDNPGVLCDYHQNATRVIGVAKNGALRVRANWIIALLCITPSTMQHAMAMANNESNGMIALL